RERQCEHREPGSPGDPNCKYRQDRGRDCDREGSIRGSDGVLEPEDAEQERRVLFVVADAIRCERDPCGNTETGDRQRGERETSSIESVAIQWAIAPGWTCRSITLL